jgi:hypothetical protein
MYLSLTHLDAEKNCGPEKKSDQQMDVISSAQWKKKKFKRNTVLARAIRHCIKSSVLVAFGHHVPYALFCEWLQQWPGTQTLSATMHNHVCEDSMWWFVTEKELLTLLLLDLKTIHICDQLSSHFLLISSLVQSIIW